MKHPLASLVMATRNRREQLARTIQSLREMAYPGLEIIAVDDGSTDGTLDLLRENSDFMTVSTTGRVGPFSLNGSKALNLGHWLARADVVLEQGGEVAHLTDCLTPLLAACQPGVAAFARVLNGTAEELGILQGDARAGLLPLADDVQMADVLTDWSKERVPKVGPRQTQLYCGLERPAPLFFLGAIHRADFAAVGGYDESKGLAYRNNDGDMAAALMGRRVKFHFSGNALAFHQRHPKC